MRKYILAIVDPALKNSLLSGVGYVYDSQPQKEKEIVKTLFNQGVIQVLISTPEMSWLEINPSLSMLLRTENKDGTDYALSYLLQMVGMAKNFCVVMCHERRKSFYLQCLLEPIFLESQLSINLHDHLNSEIVTGIIESKQDAVDYLTWTFFYRRLHLNPNYYGLSGNSNRHISSFLSDLVETTLEDLCHSGSIIIQTNDCDIESSNFGKIASHYYVKYTTIEIFKASVHNQTRQKGLMEILCASSEFEYIIMRKNEKLVVDKIISSVPLLSQSHKISESQRKTLALLIAHFSRLEIKGDLTADLNDVLLLTRKLIAALVDVIASLGLVKPLLSAMEISQMVTQGQWSSDSPLIQLPHFDRNFAKKCNQFFDIDSIYALIDANESHRVNLMSHLTAPEKADIMKACNRYSDIHMDIAMPRQFSPSTPTKINLTLQNKSGTECSFTFETRHTKQMDNVLISKSHEEPSIFCAQYSSISVEAPRYPAHVVEEWWILGVDSLQRTLFIKKVRRKTGLFGICEVEFRTEVDYGLHNFTLHLISDSFLGCDQEHNIEYVVS